MTLHTRSLLGAMLASCLLGNAQAATVFEIDNNLNNSVDGAQDIFPTDDLIIGYRGSELLDDESIDFFRFSLNALDTLTLNLTLLDGDLEAGRQPPRMDLYTRSSEGAALLVDAGVNYLNTGTFISFLAELAGDYFLGVSGTAVTDPDAPLPFDTNLTYNVEVAVAPVPVPAAAWLLASALPALAFGRSRKH
jgi:hypothetical protein